MVFGMKRMSQTEGPRVRGGHHLSHEHCSFTLGRCLTPVLAPGLPSPRPPVGLGHQSPSRTCWPLGIPNSVLTPWDDSFIVFLKLMFIFTKVRDAQSFKSHRLGRRIRRPLPYSSGFISSKNEPHVTLSKRAWSQRVVWPVPGAPVCPQVWLLSLNIMCDSSKWSCDQFGLSILIAELLSFVWLCHMHNINIT